MKHGGRFVERKDFTGYAQPTNSVPDYLSDLNAMHEAEKTLSEVQGEEYVSHLGIQSWSDPHWFAVISATAAQRAEAFLKTIGKWRDEG